MNLKNNRALSFLTLFFVYLIASLLGILVYVLLPFSVWLNLLLADVFATVITFVFSLAFKNASVYDPYWSVQPIVILLPLLVSEGVTLARLLVFLTVLIWGVRLTANWAYTFKGLNHQDWRYTMLGEKTGALYPFVNFSGIHMFPTLVVYLATLPAVCVMHSSGEMNVFVYLSLAVSLLAVLLQAVSDIQMQKFRKNRTANFIRTGLWKYSRHPNYLGEILMWWGISLAAVALLGFRWYYLLGAALNTVMFLVISIPLAEGRQSKKEGFEEYKKATRMLLPIYKKYTEK